MRALLVGRSLRIYAYTALEIPWRRRSRGADNPIVTSVIEGEEEK